MYAASMCGGGGSQSTKRSECLSTAPDKHHIYSQIFSEGGKSNDLWLQQKLSSPVAHKLQGSSWQLAVRSVATFNIKAHGPLQLQESTRSPAEVRKACRGLLLKPLDSKTLNLFRI